MAIGGAVGFFLVSNFTVNAKFLLKFKEVEYDVGSGEKFDATAEAIHYPTGIALMTMLFGFYISNNFSMVFDTVSECVLFCLIID